MKKVLIALALVAASAVPALANYGPEPATPQHHATLSHHERRAEMRAREVPDLRQAHDPYWSPCNYNSDTDPNSCL
jgi:hypothetical protein